MVIRFCWGEAIVRERVVEAHTVSLRNDKSGTSITTCDLARMSLHINIKKKILSSKAVMHLNKQTQTHPNPNSPDNKHRKVQTRCVVHQLHQGNRRVWKSDPR